MSVYLWQHGSYPLNQSCIVTTLILILVIIINIPKFVDFNLLVIVCPSNVILIFVFFCRPGNSDATMQFRFNTDFNSSRNILIACSMLLENKDRKTQSSLSLNNVGLTVSPADPPTKTQSLSRSFLGSVKQSSKQPLHNKDEKGGLFVKKGFFCK